MARPRGRRRPVSGQGVGLSVQRLRVDPRRIRELRRSHSPSLRDPTGAHSSHSSTMPATLCKAMYLSTVMKVPSSRGSCTSRSHPHFSHASDIHWGGSELVIMSESFQNLARRRDPLATNCPSPSTPSSEPIPCMPDVLKCHRGGRRRMAIGSSPEPRLTPRRAQRAACQACCPSRTVLPRRPTREAGPTLLFELTRSTGSSEGCSQGNSTIWYCCAGGIIT